MRSIEYWKEDILEENVEGASKGKKSNRKCKIGIEQPFQSIQDQCGGLANLKLNLSSPENGGLLVLSAWTTWGVG
jgi:hypothetical protein